MRLNISVLIDDDATTREDLIEYIASVIEATIEFDKKEGIDALENARDEWVELNASDDRHLKEHVAELLDAYDTDSLKVLAEDSIATATNVFVNNLDSGINLVVGKVMLHALSDPEWETDE